MLLLAIVAACGSAAPPALAPPAQKERIAVLDMHVHLLSPANFGAKAITADAVVPQLDAAGVDKAIVLSGAYRLAELDKAKAENDFIAAEVARHPQRLVGFCAVHLRQDWAAEELARCATLGLRGVKLHPAASGIDLVDADHLARIDAVLRKAGELAMLVLIDGNAPDERAAGNLLRACIRNPKTTIVIAHALNLHYRRLVTLAMIRLENPDMPRNVFVDVSGVVPFFADSPERDNIVWVLRKIGISQVVYGTDFPVFTPQQALAAFDTYPFTADERRAILRTNLAGLLERKQ